MTTIYFIRHAQSDITVRDGRIRPLTAKGRDDCKLAAAFLQDKRIDAVLSSPYKRALDTMAGFAKKNGFEIEIVEDFREQKSSSNWDRENDYLDLLRRQWADFSYVLTDGESLAGVQSRNIAALNGVLTRHKDKNIAIGTHGTALSTIINYYDNTYGFDDFMAMLNIMPWVVRMEFDGFDCIGMEKIDLFQPDLKPDYSRCIVQTADLGALKAYRFVVIFARCQNKWLYSRANGRDTFETAGGHIEQGETPPAAAKRELYEETGAARFDITPAFDYSVRIPTAYSYGQVFLAHIHELGAIPDYEMAEIKRFDAIPDTMRFPQILPVLYGKMQMWLNLQSAKDEIWDVYDSDRNLTGKTHRRADPLAPGDFHLVVHVWMQNSKGELLITQRAPNKGYPYMWECTGGSAVTGDDSAAAAIREVKEETGLDIMIENGVCIFTDISDDTISDIWLFRQELDIGGVVLQENETIGAKYVTVTELRAMLNNGEFLHFSYLEDLFSILSGGT
jgi:2,3-bisphosphoglycerate-dependent phosphoglycerate mutase